MAYTVTFIPGDGIGPEVSDATRRVLEATGVPFQWEFKEAGQEALDRYGETLPADVLESIVRNKVAIKGPVTTPVGTGFRSINVALRQELDLFACIRPCKNYPGIPTKFPGVDLVIFRENSEDLYAGIEFEGGSLEASEMIEQVKRLSGKDIRADSGITIKPISVYATRRIATAAFEYARKFRRRRVTIIHKANIMKFTDGLFLRVAREVAARYPEIRVDDLIIDNMTMQLVQRPEEFDILLEPNLYGDVLSDLCAALVGGLGVAPGANVGKEVAVFEPTHGSAPKFAGQNKMNPIAMILSGVLMLRHLDEMAAADRLERAVASVIAEGTYVTADLKANPNDGTAVGTDTCANAIIDRMRDLGDSRS